MDEKGKATILTVSIDAELGPVKKHLDKKAWHATHNTWALPIMQSQTATGQEAQEMPPTRLPSHDTTV